MMKNYPKRNPLGMARKWVAMPGTGTAEPAGFKKRIFRKNRETAMIKFLLWCILLVLCWPLALLALLAYPFIWLLLLPFRLLGIAVEGVLELFRAVILLPARVLGAPRRA